MFDGNHSHFHYGEYRIPDIRATYGEIKSIVADAGGLYFSDGNTVYFMHSRSTDEFYTLGTFSGVVSLQEARYGVNVLDESGNITYIQAPPYAEEAARYAKAQ